LSQLPKRLREALIKEGNDNYSLDTGLPKPLAEGREMARRTIVRWGSDSLEESAEKKRMDRWWSGLTRKQQEVEKGKDRAYDRRQGDTVKEYPAYARTESEPSKPKRRHPSDIAKLARKAARLEDNSVEGGESGRSTSRQD
jgi:hypothetical protein